MDGGSSRCMFWDERKRDEGRERRDHTRIATSVWDAALGPKNAPFLLETRDSPAQSLYQVRPCSKRTVITGLSAPRRRAKHPR